MSSSRREALRLAGGAAMATTLLPVAGRHRAWSHPAESKLATRPLGRTGREVTTFGLAGGNKVMWDLPGEEGVEIVVKAVRSGITYLETANNYQLSQLNYNKAFRILNLIPGRPGYDAALRGRLFLATKTGLRHAVLRDGARGMGRSAGGGATCVDDLMRALTQFFGDGKGHIPDGAYLDLMQIHSLTHESDVDAVYEGLDNPSDKSLPRIGAIAGLVDFRDGTNFTGVNPKERKLIRHIGITGHENPTAHMYAMRRDTKNNLETLLVAINPNDRNYFCHQTNSVPVAAAKNMGIIGMKVFADGAMYGLRKAYAAQPGQSVATVGQPGKVSYRDFLHYTLAAPGVSTVIAGIGLIDRNNDPERDQLVADLAACQTVEPMTASRRRQIEQETADRHGADTNFFQRTSVGLVAPQTVKAQREQNDVRIEWSTAFAAGDPLVRYEVYRRGQKLGEMPFQPQLTEAPFQFRDDAPPREQGGLWYHVRAVDSAGRHADSISVKPV